MPTYPSLLVSVPILPSKSEKSTSKLHLTNSPSYGLVAFPVNENSRVNIDKDAGEKSESETEFIAAARLEVENTSEREGVGGRRTVHRFSVRLVDLSFQSTEGLVCSPRFSPADGVNKPMVQNGADCTPRTYLGCIHPGGTP